MCLRLCILLVLALTEALAAADTPPPAPVTVHERSVRINGRDVRYTARAGLLTILDEADKPNAEVFYVFYQRSDGVDPASRPLSFCWNGGPGSASFWLHLGLGPRRVALTPEGMSTAEPWRLEDNDHSWLEFTDLVFVDAVETGFSRAMPGENPDQFFGYANDVRASGQFIKRFLTESNRWTSPIYLVGESYAGVRVAGLSEHLQFDTAALRVAGTVFISAAISFQAISITEDSPVPHLTLLPSLAATAMHHHRLAPELERDFEGTLREVEEYSRTGYAIALLKGHALPDAERRAVAERLARYTGLPAEDILAANLRIDTDLFRTRLLADSRQILGLFDARHTAFNRAPLSERPAIDPFLTEMRSPFGRTIRHYLATELGYRSERDYRVSTKVSPWVLDTDRALNTAPALARAMTANPMMKVWIANGLHDLATTYFSSRYIVDQLNVDPRARAAIKLTTYRAGHMIYLPTDAMRQAAEDARDFYLTTP